MSKSQIIFTASSLTIIMLTWIFVATAAPNNDDAYTRAMQTMQNKGAVSCDPNWAYNLILSRATGRVNVRPVSTKGGQEYSMGLDPELACRIAKLMQDNPGVKIISGYRTLAHQQALVRQGKTKAKPGSSCHNYGLAADLQFPGWSRSKIQRILSKYKLHLAYHSNAHVQCVEHRVAGRNSANGCRTPCYGSAVTITASDGVLQGTPQLPSSQTPAFSPTGFGSPTGGTFDNYNYGAQQYVATNYPEFDNATYSDSELDVNSESWWSDYIGPESYPEGDGSVLQEDDAHTNTVPAWSPVLGLNNATDKTDIHQNTSNNSNIIDISNSARRVPSPNGSYGVLQQESFNQDIQPGARDSLLDFFTVANTQNANYSYTQDNLYYIDSANNGKINQDIYNSWRNSGNDISSGESLNINYNSNSRPQAAGSNNWWSATKKYMYYVADVGAHSISLTSPVVFNMFKLW